MCAICTRSNHFQNYQALVTKMPDQKSRHSSGPFLFRMMKAFIGAVHVDTGYDIQKTDDIIMPMFKKEIDVIYNKVFSNLKVL